MRWPDRAWPVAPRPFSDETFGSWFGRVASRYRMGIDELAEDAGVTLEIDATCQGWLTMPPPSDESLRRLAWLARLPSNALTRLESERSPPRWLVFCHLCLFLNPVSVEEPYWRSGWVAQSDRWCATHHVQLARVRCSLTASARNLTKLLKHISRHRVTRFRWERDIADYSAASKVRDHR
jgi:hypothetical protein